MDTTFTESFGGVELIDALPVLLKNVHDLERLRKGLGPKISAEVEKLSIENIIQGNFCEQIYDFFSDELRTNQSQCGQAYFLIQRIKIIRIQDFQSRFMNMEASSTFGRSNLTEWATS